MSASRNALGRGLSALIPTKRPIPESSEIVAKAPHSGSSVSIDSPPAESIAGDDLEPSFTRLPIDKIDPNPDQPRRVFDPERLQKLASSIAKSGVIQPIVVSRAGDRYLLIVGERRWRASQAAGLTTIPAVIADVDPSERLELAIVENLQREDLNPIELAHAYRALAQRGATQGEIGRRVGMDRSSVANMLRLLELSVDIQGDVEAGRLSMGHAKALLGVGDEGQRGQLRDQIVAEQLSVRETERRGRALSTDPSSAPKPRRSRAEKGQTDPRLEPLAELLRGHFQARVRLIGTPDAGRLEIQYSSGEDLDRISRLILEGF